VNLPKRAWLAAVPWSSVVQINHALCQSQQTEPLTKPAAFDQARALWDAAAPRAQSLPEVLDLCRQCYDLTPFVFNTGNTFAAVARTLIEDDLKSMPPVESQILRTTIGHYIVGLIGKRELFQVLKHFEAVWAGPTPPPAARPRPVSDLAAGAAQTRRATA
jgi:hypothetical protein